jgi:PAS domain S-box-containing protein
MPADAVKDWLWAFAQQSLDYAIVLVGQDQRILWANPGAGWILVATASEIIGSSVTRFFTPEDIAFGIPQHEMRSALRQGSSDDDRWMLRADGSRFWSAGRTVALTRTDGAPMGYFKIFRDLTHVEMRISNLSNQALMMAADSEARAETTALIANALRDRLAALGTAADVLRNGDAADAGEEWLGSIERDVRTAARLVDELEGAAREDGRSTGLRIEVLQLHDVLQAAIDSSVRRFPPGQRGIELLLPLGLPITIEGDRSRLRQVFTILLGNAIQATRDDGRIWINGTVESGDAVVRIGDDGTGIPPGVLASLFDMFTRPSPPVGPVGSGLGLMFVRTIVEQHGGTMQASSPGPGKGSEFTVRLPLRQEGGSSGPATRNA